MDQRIEQFDRTKTKTTFEGRYYFKNNRLIEQVTTGHNRFEDDSIDPAKPLLKEARESILQLTKKKVVCFSYNLRESVMLRFGSPSIRVHFVFFVPGSVSDMKTEKGHLPVASGFPR